MQSRNPVSTPGGMRLVVLALTLLASSAFAGALAVNETSTTYEFTARSSQTSSDAYDWYLVSEQGYSEYLGRTGHFQSTLQFNKSLSSLPAGCYRVKIDTWTWVYEWGQYVYMGDTTPCMRLPIPPYDVGVIPASNECPSGFEKVAYRMDNEDYDPKSDTGDWTGAIQKEGNRNILFVFCRMDGRRLKPLGSAADASNTYGVLKLGKFCPPGSKEFMRHFDNEDDNNQNELRSGEFTSNNFDNIMGWTDMKFCLFNYETGVGTMSRFPALGFEYGVFATQAMRLGLRPGDVYTDDEDGRYDNNNYFAPDDFVWKADATKIVTEGLNTHLYTVQVRRDLANGVATGTFSGEKGSGDEGTRWKWQYWTFEVPSGMGKATFTLSGESTSEGNADLYVRSGAPPTDTLYQCRSSSTGNNESCVFNSPSAGIWYVMVKGISNYSGVTLKATYALEQEGPPTPDPR